MPSLRKSALLHIGLTIPKSVLFGATLHTAAWENNFHIFPGWFPSVYTTLSCAVCSSQSNTLPCPSLTAATSCWLPDCPFLLPISCQTLPPLILLAHIYALFPAPFTSPCRWRQQSSPKCWYPTTTLCCVTFQKTST